jgi:hypothetical protein
MIFEKILNELQVKSSRNSNWRQCLSRLFVISSWLAINRSKTFAHYKCWFTGPINRCLSDSNPDDFCFAIFHFTDVYQKCSFIPMPFCTNTGYFSRSLSASK